MHVLANREVGGPSPSELPSEAEIVSLPQLLKEARARPRLPLLVLDAMVPRQRMNFGTEHDAVAAQLQRMADEGEIGVVGVDQTSGPLQHGVTAALARLEGNRWQLVARQHMRLVGSLEADSSGEALAMAQVELVQDGEPNEADVASARALEPLVQEWVALVQRNRRERFEGQLPGILADLGPMPPPELPGRLAFWVAGLVNPLPALGVAYEIRPAALAALTVADRLHVATEGIQGSIGHVSGWKKLF